MLTQKIQAPLLKAFPPPQTIRSCTHLKPLATAAKQGKSSTNHTASRCHGLLCPIANGFAVKAVNDRQLNHLKGACGLWFARQQHVLAAAPGPCLNLKRLHLKYASSSSITPAKGLPASRSIMTCMSLCFIRHAAWYEIPRQRLSLSEEMPILRNKTDAQKTT